MRNKWWLYGKYFGYPNCCIEAFMKGEHMKGLEHNKFYGTGFVPCKDCYNKNVEDVINIINTNRISPTVFENKIKRHTKEDLDIARRVKGAR